MGDTGVTFFQQSLLRKERASGGSFFFCLRRVTFFQQSLLRKERASGGSFFFCLRRVTFFQQSLLRKERASGGPLFPAAGKVGKRAAKNRWFLDFLLFTRE